MPRRLNPTEFAAYRVLAGDPNRPLRFSELLDKTGKTARVLSHQLMGLIDAGLVIRIEPTGRRDRRVRWLYQIGPGWPWRQNHDRIIRQVARAISERRVPYSLTAGSFDPGVNSTLIYTNLIVEPEPRDSDAYPHGEVNHQAIERAVKAVRDALKGQNPRGEHWRVMLRRLIAEVVTSQSRSFFLLSYPASCFRFEGEGHPWPDPLWKDRRNPPHVSVRLSKRQRGFLEGHGSVMEALRVVTERPKQSVKEWERTVHGPPFDLPRMYCSRQST